jgi:alkanesulfonate monooxygenase SsuD/methylene tetrahydromethanopterin reductase-like flavin-dependent oxidoreductase (luciferase family)
MMFSLLRMGRLIPIPPPEKALAYLATRERDPNTQKRRAIVGTPDQVRAGLEAVAAEYGAAELMVLTITYEHEARRRSYELIAEAFSGGAGGLEGLVHGQEHVPARDEPVADPQ